VKLGAFCPAAALALLSPFHLHLGMALAYIFFVKGKEKP
jgi:hypothetical protein